MPGTEREGRRGARGDRGPGHRRPPLSGSATLWSNFVVSSDNFATLEPMRAHWSDLVWATVQSALGTCSGPLYAGLKGSGLGGVTGRTTKRPGNSFVRLNSEGTGLRSLLMLLCISPHDRLRTASESPPSLRAFVDETQWNRRGQLETAGHIPHRLSSAPAGLPALRRRSGPVSCPAFRADCPELLHPLLRPQALLWLFSRGRLRFIVVRSGPLTHHSFQLKCLSLDSAKTTTVLCICVFCVSSACAESEWHSSYSWWLCPWACMLQQMPLNRSCFNASSS